MTNPDQGVLDIARDAIREGKSELVPGILADQPKTMLVGKLLDTLAALARSAGITYVSLHLTSSGPSCSLQCESVDALAEDLASSGWEITIKPHDANGDAFVSRQVFARRNGLYLNAMSNWRDLTPAEKRKRTIERKRKEREQRVAQLAQPVVPSDLSDDDFLPF